MKNTTNYIKFKKVSKLNFVENSDIIKKYYYHLLHFSFIISEKLVT